MSEALLEAGAILLGGEPDAGRDVVTARRYTHPALAGRTVVRLAGATLGEAEDLSLEFLGFTRAGAPTAVGTARRQSLGFPAWALINDPANGRHALAMVKEMTRLARTAVSKPGNARDGYQQLAARLGAAAPHFLPTFWEQAGRAFLAADNSRMAGGCFAEARRAEQVHGLAVDEDRLREAHLEFAFAGALTAKMLTEYARAVAVRKPAAEAYDLVRTLAVRRVAGGLPPYVGMAEDLRRLAKAAGLDPERQAEAVIGQLLAFPAMSRSHESVWKAYRGPLVGLARRDPTVRARLLEILPEPTGGSTGLTDSWLELLEATGALDDLLAGHPAAATVSAGRWLERLTALRLRRDRRRSDRLIQLVRRLVPRLRTEDRPLTLWTGYAHQADLDILDVCLAGEVPVTGDPGSGHFAVAWWVQDTRAGRRDLRAVAADPRCRPLLARGAADALAELHNRQGPASGPLPAQLLTDALGAPGLRDVLAELLVERAARVPEGTLLGLDDALSQLAAVWSPAGVALAPEAFTALAAVEVPAVLARSLRAGLVAELGWPAYEEVAADKLNRRYGDGWPQLVVHDNRTAHVVDVDASTTEHVFRYPVPDSPHARMPHAETMCRLIGGQLLVTWYGGGRSGGYWSADPDALFEPDHPNDHALWGRRSLPLPLPDGAVTTGTRPWHAGDSRSPAQGYPVASDGTTFWRCEPPSGPTSGDWRWREYDPATADDGRYSLPAFFAADLPAGATLIPALCELRPAPPRFAASPLGWRDGLVGWRVSRLPDGTQIGEAVDGRRVSWHPDSIRASRNPFHGAALVAALRIPGSETVLPVTGRPQYRTELDLTVWTADGREPVDRCGPSRHLPPLPWWHALRPRDEPGSSQLRQLDEATTARLMTIDDSVTKTTELTEAALGTVTAVLTGVTDPVLRAAIAEKVVRAVRLRRRLNGLPRLLAAGPTEEIRAETVPDDVLRQAWSGLLPAERFHYYGGSAAQTRREILPQIRAVAELLTGAAAQDVPAASPVWVAALGGLGALAVRAASPVTEGTHRDALAALLFTVADTVLADAGPSLRMLTVTQDQAPVPNRAEVLRDGAQVTVLLEERHRVWYASQRQVWPRTAVQLAPGGRFTPPPGTTVETETAAAGWRGADRIRDFCRLLAERGPVPWRPERVDELVERTGMTRAEAAMLLAGLPAIDDWQANFLTADQRRTLGVNTTQARTARDALKSLSYGERIALVDAAMPADPVDLWRRGPDVDGLAARWLALRGVRVSVPEQLLTEAVRILPPNRAADMLQTILDPAPGSWLTTDGESSPGDWGRLDTTAAAGTPFDGNHLYTATAALLWLAYRLPWGDPIRDALPPALELVRERLRNPRLLVGAGWHPVGEQPAVGSALVPGQSYQDAVVHHLAPARLTGPDDPAIGFVEDAVAETLRLVLSVATTAVVATPADARGEHRDPRVSVPDLVDAVATYTGLGHDPAGYYLQLLALPDPTDANVRTWNGWKPAALKQTQAALVEAGLVVVGKRERAGRGVFLPGGWHPARSPSLPMESWKQPLHQPFNGLPLLTRPTPEQFHTAWDRVTTGDAPRYLDLQENA